MRFVRLNGFEQRQPAALPGGQKQRSAITSVLSLSPHILSMDEPTTDLDPMFLTTIRNTNQLAMALESKGFGAVKKRTFYSTVEYRACDSIAIIILVGLLFVNFALRWNGYGRIVGLTVYIPE